MNTSTPRNLYITATNETTRCPLNATILMSKTNKLEMHLSDYKYANSAHKELASCVLQKLVYEMPLVPLIAATPDYSLI